MHKELIVGLITEVDAIPEEFVYAKFKIKKIKDSVKFNIIWGQKVSQEVRSDLKIYLSCKYREPSELKCSVIIQNVSISIINLIIAKKFHL